MNHLREMRKKAGYTQKQLANMLFVNQTAVSQWERGVTVPSQSTLFALCDLYGTTVDYLLGRTDDPSVAQGAMGQVAAPRRGVKIPVLGRVAAGVPIEAIEEIIDYEEIDSELAKQGEFFALRVHGDSMEPRIWDGDVVIVRRQSDVDTGDVAVVLVNGCDATVKRVLKREAGLVLQPFNPSHELKFFTQEETTTLPVVIIGKVVELRGKL